MGIAIYKYKINFDFFNNKKEKYWYFIGFIASDGYISDDKIEIALNMKDEYMIKNFRDLICPDKPVYYKPKTNSVRFTIHSKEIIQYDLNMQKIKEWGSITDASETLGITTIDKCLSFKRKTAGGFIWRYKN